MFPSFAAGRRGAAARSSRPARRPTSRGSPTRRRRGCRLRSRATGGPQGDARCGATCGARGVARRLPGDRRLGGRRGRAIARAARGGGRGAARATAASRSASRPGRAWERARFHGPYLRDDLLDRGVLAETLETATTWSNLFALYARGRRRAARSARRRSSPATSRTSTRRAPRCTSRSSPARSAATSSSSGARPSRRRATRSSAAGGTITHHHAVGPRPRAVAGAPRSATPGSPRCARSRRELDPAGIMNPGKLLPPARGLAAARRQRPAQVDRGDRALRLAGARASRVSIVAYFVTARWSVGAALGPVACRWPSQTRLGRREPTTADAVGRCSSSTGA